MYWYMIMMIFQQTNTSLTHSHTCECHLLCLPSPQQTCHAQFEFNLLNQKNLSLIKACQDLGVTPLIYNPLGKNKLASGLYTTNDLKGGKPLGPKPFSYRALEKLNPLHIVQETVADRAESRAQYNAPQRRGARGRGYRDDEEEVSHVSS